MTALNEVNFDNWHIGDIQTSNKGARNGAINEMRGGIAKPIVLQLTPLSEPLCTPFGITSFGQYETTRKSLELRCTPALEEFMRSLDDWTKAYLAEHADRLFKGKPCEYRECLQQKGEYPSQVRCKLNLTGIKACRFWNQNRERMSEVPEDVRAPCELVPICQVKNLWVMHKEVGLTLECTDLMCIMPDQRCPFQEVAPFN